MNAKSKNDGASLQGELLFDQARLLIEASEYFDANWYGTIAGRRGKPKDLIEHYLTIGWAKGLDPNASFKGAWLYPYFRSVGFRDPPILTYLRLRAANWPVFANRASAEHVASVVRVSEFFDAEYYARRVPDLGDLDLALHYVTVGEQLGLAPSPGFDPKYYADRNPDLRQRALPLLYHHIMYGRRDGRRPLCIADQLKFDRSRLDPRRKTILIVTHQASRTGAPILAYNIAKRLSERFNVVTLVLLPGELMPDFEHHSAAVIGPVTSEVEWVQSDGVNPVEAEYIVRRLLANYSISYAFANSIDSRTMLPPLTASFVPVVALVHEFGPDLDRIDRPPGEMGRALEWATQIVFSSKATAESARADYPHLGERPVHILPQGLPQLPPRGESNEQQSDKLARAVRPPGAERQVVVLGCGTIFPRKGVDLFFKCAALVATMSTKHPVRFVWIGRRRPSLVDNNYFNELHEIIDKAGIADRAIIVDEVSDLEPALAAADIFFVSSRLDPLPNVAIDAALRGIPIVCFEGAGGVPEFLHRDQAASIGAVGSFDVSAAASAIAKVADDADLRRQVGDAVQQLGRRTFDMDRYVEQLNALGQEAARVMRQRVEDFETLRHDPMFDMWHFLDYGSPILSRDDAIRQFLARAAAVGTTTQPTANFFFRRPCPGFHPQIYVHENATKYDAHVVNSLAHFIRTGKPDGPWCHDVITPSQSPLPHQPGNLRVGIHAHFFYPELVLDFLSKLQTNTARCDLLFSTNSQEKAKALHRATARYDRGNVLIKVIQNRGRDIGPLLTAFSEELGKYDIVGHLHSKRTFHHPDPTLGERWREFLWQNLLGGHHPMMDTILSRFATDASAGLIFADEPHLSDWTLNRGNSENLARKMGIAIPLPQYIDFPAGTMFWARYAALEPLRKLQLGWDDYPSEPAPLDGTILHAIERLLPSIAQHAGYRYATTHVPGVTW
jgi:glycosyltransferase involved in cell wall biosynthesis